MPIQIRIESARISATQHHEDAADDRVEPVVEDLRLDRRHLRCRHRARRERFLQGVGLREEAEAGQRREDLLIAGRVGHDDQPDQREDVTHMYFAPCIFIRIVVPTQSAMRGEQLVGDAEERPERVDAAQRIAHALDQEVTPGQARSRRSSR